ncbi:MAG: ribonuclease III [Phycisphaerales bacterium]|nr:MAG: ribonuclease III [Phycisphaerales bacterium]
MDSETLHEIETLVGHTFHDRDLLRQALTHASIAPSRVESNERLEFLGDAVLGLIVCQRIYSRFPEALEGEMTKIKSSVVSRQTCAEIAKDLGLDSRLVLGKGMQNTELPMSLGAAVLESVIGAIYLDGGFDAAARFIHSVVEPYIDEGRSNGHQQNYKSVLQQHSQQAFGMAPLYRIVDEQGPDHAKCFKICVEIQQRRFEPSWGNSKKKAEQNAALNALRELGVVRVVPGGEVHIVAIGAC